jgi:hypothetical protein
MPGLKTSRLWKAVILRNSLFLKLAFVLPEGGNLVPKHVRDAL